MLTRRHGIARLALVAALAVHLGVPLRARAAGPRERVEATVRAVSAVLGDAPSQGAANETQRKQQVRQIIRDAFDFSLMARDSLGTHWATLTPQQRDEFVGLFGALFERSYDRLVLRFLGQSRTTYGAEAVEAHHALVRTTLLRRDDDEIPVDYRLSYDGRRWAMSDVVVDGVSLAANFRAQFAKTLRDSSFEGLTQKIRTKLEQESTR